jgi:hypothetical protein
MICIIVDNHAHRLLKNGAVESAKVIKKSDAGLQYTSAIILDDWSILSPEQGLNMTSGDFDAFIRKPLEVLHAIFPADRTPLPSSEKTEQVAPSVNEVRE